MDIWDLISAFENMNDKCHCPIWKSYGQNPSTLAKKLHDEEIYSIYSCPRAGGIFGASGILPKEEFSDEIKIKVSRWIYEANCLNKIPVLTVEEIERISSQPRLRIDKRIDLLLQCIEKRQINNWMGIRLLRHLDFSESEDEFISKAATECLDRAELAWLANAAVELEFIRINEEVGPPSHSLTAKGMKRLEEIWGGSQESERAFVAMWFDQSVDQAYKNGIEPAIIAAGYRAVRVDQIEHADKIDDRIIAEIRRSRFLVCDFTCGVYSESDPPVGVARGGVYFEAGFAYGLNIPVIWTCREDCLDHLHFDVRQFNTIVWNTPEYLRKKLQVRIEAIIGDGPLRKS